MGKPAARTNDMHTCPVESPVPHVGGPIIGATCTTVLIEGLPAATVYSICTCTGPPDEIISGSTTVVVNGKLAARKYDKSQHGGTITTGSATVLIGGQSGTMLWEEKKVKIIKQTIQSCITLMEKKHKLLVAEDPATIQQFEKCFGRKDKEAIKIIAKRILDILAKARELSDRNFITVSHENKQRGVWADVWPEDASHTIRLNNSFWTVLQNENLKAGLVIHELSHFKSKDVDSTKDVVYHNSILRLAKQDAENALYNADNFEYFIIEEN